MPVDRAPDGSIRRSLLFGTVLRVLSDSPEPLAPSEVSRLVVSRCH